MFRYWLCLPFEQAFIKMGEWIERTRRLLAKRNTGMRLRVCLAAVGESVDAAVGQFERRLEVR
jgi:hypothetical protein